MRSLPVPSRTATRRVSELGKRNWELATVSQFARCARFRFPAATEHGVVGKSGLVLGAGNWELGSTMWGDGPRTLGSRSSSWHARPIRAQQRASCRLHCAWLFPAGTVTDHDFDPAYAVDFWDLTNREDWAVCEGVQRGTGNFGYRPGPLSSWEATVYQFLTMIGRAYLGEGLTPSPVEERVTSGSVAKEVAK